MPQLLHNFSTWDGVAGLYVADLHVRPRFRRRGLARALYGAIGGQPQPEWSSYRLSGPRLAELAEPR